jgi:hypothetical protein
MFERLLQVLVSKFLQIRFCLQLWALEQSLPWVVGIVVITCVEENRPMVAWNCHFPTAEFRFDPTGPRSE